MTCNRMHGRFLPSRVYSRWKWTVRLGLLLVPFLVLLGGGLELFLTPSKFRSTTLFSLENGPPPQEVSELLKSRGTLDRTVGSLELVNRFSVDRDTAIEILHKSTTVKVVPDTRLVEISAKLTDKALARDIAQQIPTSLREHLAGIAKIQNEEKAAEMDQLLREAGDAAEEKSTAVANLEKVRGENAAESPASADLQRARRASLLADAEVERLQSLRTDRLNGNLDSLPRLIIHNAPVIANMPCEPAVGETLSELTIRSLVSGLLAALLIPYLMELAFPPRRSPASSPDPVADL